MLSTTWSYASLTGEMWDHEMGITMFPRYFLSLLPWGFCRETLAIYKSPQMEIQDMTSLFHLVSDVLDGHIRLQ